MVEVMAHFEKIITYLEETGAKYHGLIFISGKNMNEIINGKTDYCPL
jgi:hypothetical protein